MLDGSAKAEEGTQSSCASNDERDHHFSGDRIEKDVLEVSAQQGNQYHQEYHSPEKEHFLDPKVGMSQEKKFRG